MWYRIRKRERVGDRELKTTSSKCNTTTMDKIAETAGKMLYRV